MRTIHIWRTAVLLAFVAGLAGLAVDAGPVLSAASLVVTVASVVVGVIAERRAIRHMMDELQREKEREFMRAIGQYRHDWMNDLQVLFGYVSLKKYDKLTPYLEKIKSKLSEESHIANIGHTSLSLLLMSYRLYSQDYELIVSMDGTSKLNQLPIRPDRLVQRVKEGLQLFQQASLPSAEEHNKLSLSIVTADEHIQLAYKYTGLVDDQISHALHEWRSLLHDEEGSRLDYTFEDGQVDVSVVLYYE